LTRFRLLTLKVGDNIRTHKSDEASRDDEVLYKIDVRNTVICVFYSMMKGGAISTPFSFCGMMKNERKQASLLARVYARGVFASVFSIIMTTVVFFAWHIRKHVLAPQRTILS